MRFAQIDSYSDGINQNFIVVVDEHSARKELLITATKTMFGQQPARRLLSPPFEAESYLDQNIQAADWIATIVARLWNYRLEPVGFSKYAPYERYFRDRLHAVATHSSVWQRPAPKGEAKIAPPGEALSEAQITQQTTLVKK